MYYCHVHSAPVIFHVIWIKKIPHKSMVFHCVPSALPSLPASQQHQSLLTQKENGSLSSGGIPQKNVPFHCVSFGDFHLFLLPYFILSRSTLLTINLLQLHSSIVALDAP